jgi:hypothetical protein
MLILDPDDGQPTARSYEVWLTGVLPAAAVRVGDRQLNYSQYLGLSRGFADDWTCCCHTRGEGERGRSSDIIR